MEKHVVVGGQLVGLEGGLRNGRTESNLLRAVVCLEGLLLHEVTAARHLCSGRSLLSPVVRLGAVEQGVVVVVVVEGHVARSEGACARTACPALQG